MKKVILIIMILGFTYSFADSTVDKVQDLNRKIGQYTDNIDELVSLHQEGVTRRIALESGEIITYVGSPTAAEKLLYRTAIKASCDSISAIAQRLRALIP